MRAEEGGGQITRKGKFEVLAERIYPNVGRPLRLTLSFPHLRSNQSETVTTGQKGRSLGDWTVGEGGGSLPVSMKFEVSP